MRSGDKEGLNNVYTTEGEIILKDGEEILVQEKDLVPQIKTTWGHFGGEDVIEPTKGDIYLTNQRLIFIRNLEGVIQRIGTTSATTIAPQTYAMPMQSVGLKNIDTKKGVRDFFEIPIKEILACEIKGGMVSGGSQIYAYLLSKGEQFHLTVVVQEESGLLKRFQQNTVENVDELTNNLKIYFENTDWINLKEEELEGEQGNQQ
ncbi:hypothetical protein [[Eubacterium] cellulosolvens]